MVISQNTAGHLIIHTDWPSALKNKGVFFVKREKQPVPLDEVNLDYHSLPPAHQDFDLTEFITFGDIYPNALDHFCAWVEEVSEWKNKEIPSHLSSFPRQVLVPIFRNEANMLKYPHCVSYDIKKQVESLVLEVARGQHTGARACNGSLPNPRTHQGEDAVALSTG